MGIKRQQEDFLNLFQQQISFLSRSVESFDRGFEDEHVRMAQVIRVLVHDTANSTSLLTHLGQKNSNFYDTSFPYDPNNLMTHSSLVMLGVGDGPSSPIPLLDDGPFKRQEDFENWWNGIVFVDMGRNEFSRKDIVLTIANKEGGAHVDSSLNEDYVGLRKNNTLGWFDYMSDCKVVPSVDQVPFAMRQIAHEILITFVPQYSLNFETAFPDRQKPGILFSGASLVPGETIPEIPPRNPVKSSPVRPVQKSNLGRNDPCHCRSGKKYKKCCGGPSPRK